MTGEKQRVGRRRDSRVDRAILEATRHLLVEVGYAALTVDAVAGRAGTGKAAIYRRYATKQEMVFAAAVHGLTLTIPPDAGSLRDDLTALVRTILASLTGPATFAAIPGLFADVAADEAIAARFAQTFIAAERAHVREVLDRAARRGDMTRRPDPDLVHALLLGPVFAWLFLLGRRNDKDIKDFAATLAELATAALTTPPTAASGKPGADNTT
jgi:AcrR family transcriptional regulator